MNDQNITPESNEPPVDGGTPTDPRPLGYWLRAVDALINREFQAALAAEGIDRRDWMLLNALSGDVDAPSWLADRLARGGRRMGAFADRGWVVERANGWELTDDGRAAKERLAGLVDGVRDKVAGAVSPEDWATLTASLQAIATELGWDENERMPRGPRGFGPRGFGRAGFGPGVGAGFAPSFADDEERAEWAARMAHRGGRGGRAFGHGFRPGFGSGFGHGVGPHAEGGEPHRHGHPHHGHPHHGHGNGKGHRKAERAYERGFEAGFRAAHRADGGAAAEASDSAA